MGFYNFPFNVSVNLSKILHFLVIYTMHYQTSSSREVNKLNILDKVIHSYLQIINFCFKS